LGIDDFGSIGAFSTLQSEGEATCGFEMFLSQVKISGAGRIFDESRPNAAGEALE
jgi:hypothetical protein